MTRKALVPLLLLAVLIAFPTLAFAGGESGGSSSVDGTLNSMPEGCAWCHGPDPYAERQGPHAGFTSTTDKCDVCHNVHVAQGANLLFKTTSTATCLACHDGTGGFGVYGSIKARGLTPGAEHRSVPPTTALVPGGDPSGGFRTETQYVGEGGFLSCVDCHTPHSSKVVATYSTERERSGPGWGAPYLMQSTNLLKQRPNGSDTTATAYGSDWCAGCHRGRHSGGGAVNHPVDSTYTYDNVPLGSWPGPVEVAVDGAGNVYVADPGNRRIQRFTTAGAYVGQWNQGYGGQFSDPRGVIVAGGEVLVSDPMAGRVSRFTAAGTYLGTFINPGTRWGNYGEYSVTPAGLGTNVAATALVQADTEGNSVTMRTPPTGTFIRALGQQSVNPFPGTAANQFYAPTDAVVDSVGNVFVADSMNKRVLKYSAAGQLVGVFATGMFERPLSVTIDSSDRLYVADAGKHSVFRFLSNGTLQATFGGLGTGDGQMSAPRGVAVDTAGNIYVVDSGNSRVQKLASDGSYVTSWGTKGSGNSQFDFNAVRLGPLAYADTTRSLGQGNVYNGLGYVMQEPRGTAQVGHSPICQQCHEDTRFAGALYDGVALGGPAYTVPDGGINSWWFSTTDPVLGSVTLGPRDVATPRFQNFPHETVNDNMVVEAGDDLCLNCHGKSLP